MKKVIRKLLIFFVSASGLYGADAEKRVILCSFYPMYILTQNVAADIPGVVVENMIKPHTGCLHDYQLSPQDMKKLSSAWALIVNGGGMEIFLDKAMKQFPGLKIIWATDGIELIHTEQDLSGSGHNHDEQFNPHVWVSVSGAMAQVRNISAGLSAIDSVNSVKYQANAEKYLSSLELLKKKMHNGLANIKDRNIITFHEAFPYFAREFNLNIMAVIEREAGSEPNARELAEIIRLIKEKNVKAIFIEPQYPPKTAQIISLETGRKLYTLDPVVTGPPDPNAYITIMEANLKVLQEALH
ncbi:MAG TPA: metal ABC transporter substrate-binding protein [Chitinispirillaceae bacterium]|nr:metal ABC transporter substrate-binding protein [Chitinispirillaceae bacterium]